jgi:large subunit ribosomal protein L18e
MSKTQIEKNLRRKTNENLVKTLILLKKDKKWEEVSKILSKPKRKQVRYNLDEIDKKVKDNQVVVIPGKVLGVGELNKKVKLISFSFSDKAIKKLEKSKIKYSTIGEEINSKNKEEFIILK